MKTFLIAVTCLCVLNAQAQHQSPKVIPPSPNAFAFLKYADVPVSTYSGIPSVSVPLYEIKSGEISVPIGLSYHSSGIRVAEEASKVGLGWVINSGGMITRTIVNGDDFTSSPGFYSYHTTDAPELLQQPPVDYGGYFNVQNACALSFFPGTTTFQRYDAQPDIYNFTLPNGKSGKFMLKRNREIILEKPQLIDIIMTGDADRWTIRTPDGYSYEFNAVEQYISETYHKTAWYLTKMTSVAGTTVTFSYTSSTNYIRPIGNYYQRMPEGGTTFVNFQVVSCTMLSPISASAPGREYTNVQLDVIHFNEGQVRFFYSTRQDILNDKKLDSLVVYEKKSNSPVTYSKNKSIRFVYDYFEGTADNFEVPATTYESKRLKLKGVVDESKTGADGSNYKFEYFEENKSPALLPSKRSFGRDHWGYNNGNQGNPQLIPVFLAINSTQSLTHILGMMGSQRDADATAVKAFSLQRIWYPTGGYTELEMESNDFDIDNSNVNSGSTNIPEVAAKTRDLLYDGYVHDIVPANFNQAIQMGRVIDLTRIANADVHLNAFFKFRESQLSCPSGNETVTFELISEDGQFYESANIFQSVNFIPANGKCSGVTSSDAKDNPPYSGMEYSKNYSLAPGRYYWRLYIAPGVELFSDIAPTFTYFVRKTGGDIVQGGGLRVRRILNYESPGSVPQVSRYSYHYQEDRNSDGVFEEYSFGRRMVRPSYSDFEPSQVPDDGLEYVCEYLYRESESVVPLSSNGNAIGYDQVAVLYGDQGQNGKTTFIYHNMPDVLLDYSSSAWLVNSYENLPRMPPVNPTIASPFNGMLKKQIDFRYVSSNSFDTVRMVSTEYTNGINLQTACVWGVETRRWPNQVTPNCDKVTFLVYPAMQCSWIYPSKTVETIFDQFDQSKKSLRTSTTSYESNKHFLPTRQEESWNGKKLITTFRYPLDYSDADCSPAVRAMKTGKFISPVIERRTEEWSSNEGKVVSQDVTLFDYAPDTTKILPHGYATFLLTQPVPAANIPHYVPAFPIDTAIYQINYRLTYNNASKITTIQKPGDSPTSYLWGYQGNLPVAEIKDALPSQVIYSGFEDFGEGTTSKHKTGNASYRMDAGPVSRTLTNGKYRIEYWGNGTVNFASSGTVAPVSISPPDPLGWVLYVKELTVGTSPQSFSLSGNSTAYLDELRVYPVNAQMTTYTYELLNGITQVIDVNHNLTHFEYDAFNRLRTIRDSQGNIKKQYSYNFKIK